MQFRTHIDLVTLHGSNKIALNKSADHLDHLSKKFVNLPCMLLNGRLEV